MDKKRNSLNVRRLILVVFIFEILLTLNEGCEIQTRPSGAISDSISSYFQGTYEKCWTILVPSKSFVRLKVQEFSIGGTECSNGFLKIKDHEREKEHFYCDSKSTFDEILSLGNVDIIFRSTDMYVYGRQRRKGSFTLFYEIVDILCEKDSKSFKCSNVSCISMSKVCDGVADCQNGKDEVGCETGVFAISGLKENRKIALSLLKNSEMLSDGWNNIIHRSIVAKYLADAYDFSKPSLQDKLTVKQLELKISLALLRNATDRLSPNQLGMFINALLVTCNDPRHFYGFDLITILKNQVEDANTSVPPMAYLALCNAKESLSTQDVNKLTDILKSESEYFFLTDIQAITVMALSCMKNNTKYYLPDGNGTALFHHTATIAHFKENQKVDGSFGNVYTTALIAQALISNGEQYNTDWHLEATMKYLMNHLKSPTIDYLALYLILPLLNGKSLADISRCNCTANPLNLKNGSTVENIKNKIGPKMAVQYSLYIGDKKDIVHTISLRVPENITVYEVMQLAEAADPNYKFKSEKMHGKTYVYEIDGIVNDSEAGNFWMLYLEGGGENSEFYTDSPDEIEVQYGDHLVMWYKSVTI